MAKIRTAAARKYHQSDSESNKSSDDDAPAAKSSKYKPGPKSSKQNSDRNLNSSSETPRRGRGRPSKSVARSNGRSKSNVADSSEDEAPIPSFSLDSDSDNDTLIKSKVSQLSKTGPKSKKMASAKEPTPRGRGRPSNSKRNEISEDEAHASDANVDGDEDVPIKTPTPRGRGRPSKSKQYEISEDEAHASDANVDGDEDVPIKTPTPRGRGRPSKSLAKNNERPKSKRNEKSENEALASDGNVDSDEDVPIKTPTPRGRGRPSKSLVNDKSNDAEASSDDSSKNDDQLDDTPTKSTSKVTKRKADSSTAEKSSRGPKVHWSKKPKKLDEDRYEVEDILDHKVEDGRKYFLIRWKGYGPDVDSWEKQNTISCPALLTKYYEKYPDARLAVKPRNKRKKVVLLPIRPLKIDQEADYDSDNWDKNEDYEVEKVLDVRFHRDNKREFLIRWKGYSSNSDTWEPEEHLNCEDLIQKFIDKLERIKSVTHKELRPNRAPTKRFTLMAQSDARRLSKRTGGRQRAVYYDCDE